MSGASQSSRLSKRARANDAAQSQVAHTDESRTKRRRFARRKSENEKSAELPASEVSQELSLIDDHMSVANIHESPRRSWSSSQLGGGQYTDLEPILTPDEE